MDVGPDPKGRQMTASNNFHQQVREYCQQAMDCAQEASAQNDPKVKRQFLELTRLWLSLAALRLQ